MGDIILVIADSEFRNINFAYDTIFGLSGGGKGETQGISPNPVPIPSRYSVSTNGLVFTSCRLGCSMLVHRTLYHRCGHLSLKRLFACSCTSSY